MRRRATLPPMRRFWPSPPSARICAATGAPTRATTSTSRRQASTSGPRCRTAARASRPERPSPTPYVTAVVASIYRTLPSRVRTKTAVLQRLPIQDLGTPGPDRIYGRGLVNAPASCDPDKTPVAARRLPVTKVSVTPKLVLKSHECRGAKWQGSPLRAHPGCGIQGTPQSGLIQGGNERAVPPVLIAVTLTRFAGTSGRRGVDQQFSARAESCFYASEELNFHHEHMPARAGTPQSGLEVRRVTQRSSENDPRSALPATTTSRVANPARSALARARSLRNHPPSPCPPPHPRRGRTLPTA